MTFFRTQGPVAPILPPAARQRRVTILDQPLPDVPVQPTKSAIVDETDNAESGIYHDLNECKSVLGWGLLSQFPPFRYFRNFSSSPKYMLAIVYHVHIWQVSPQLSCGDTC